jgi:hypothetical protein
LDTKPLELEDRWEMVVEDVVNRCYFDYLFTLQLLATELTIVIEVPFILSGKNSIWTLEPEDPETMAPALSLVRKKVSKVVMKKSGVLQIYFSEGYSLTVDPSVDYEAWHVRTKNGWMFVATPGGDLAIWSNLAGEGTD